MRRRFLQTHDEFYESAATRHLRLCIPKTLIKMSSSRPNVVLDGKYPDSKNLEIVVNVQKFAVNESDFANGA